eukprot:TRINITY_DN56847_c0_g1_i1.p1 TRINITY_DN56847_c0_g1~~TRINITY_DN56847_c0_g1_i1.p1  ORF type:complete len:299 (+),score=72.08 TRINITY_DN56847_c0_g1_i1:32-898(+)
MARQRQGRLRRQDGRCSIVATVLATAGVSAAAALWQPLAPRSQRSAAAFCWQMPALPRVQSRSLPCTPGSRRACHRARQIARLAASEDVMQKVVDIVKAECPSFEGEVQAATSLATLQAESDSLDTLEAMMELEDHFKVELEDEWMEKVVTLRDLADLIWRTPRGHKLRTVDDETYIAMVKKSHAENRWGELDDLENNIPPQYEHRGPSLAEEHGELQAVSGGSPAAAAASDAASEAEAAKVESARPAAQLTVPELRERLASLGHSNKGTRAQLVARLAEVEAGEVAR